MQEEKQTSGRGAGGPCKPDVGKRGGAAHHAGDIRLRVDHDDPQALDTCTTVI